MAAVPVRSLPQLRQYLAERFPDARPLVERDAERLARPVATGIRALDAALPGGGFPRGKLSVWTPAGGAAAVLRASARAVIATGERAVWVDASRTLTFGWMSERSEPEPLVVHPPDRMQALRATELLLRSGAFALVILDGAEPIGTETVRLTRAARDGGGAFVTLTRHTAMAALRIASKLLTHTIRWRAGPFGDPAMPERVQADVRVRAMGWNARAEIVLPVAPYDVRCAVAPGPDRRGAGRRADALAHVDVE
ncbi:RecA domain protein (plasmid) [Gemmatirosa kalamazoonensis]|uniref:RecA domain protein n=1 Tax=Gemmatirosa kalamazoonensis TaxID=861299 RepID=W0RP79_9BACT|nr:hypothetical protein [Gemmatirosa kalamazoonensis]AHG92541.1 RecA domain protein [Gemmatirosa kalamazoonensis]